MNGTLRFSRWLWGGCIGLALALVIVGTFVLVGKDRGFPIQNDTNIEETIESSTDDLVSHQDPDSAVEPTHPGTASPKPHPTGSELVFDLPDILLYLPNPIPSPMVEACKLFELVKVRRDTYGYYVHDFSKEDALKTKACREAVEQYAQARNPFSYFQLTEAQRLGLYDNAFSIYFDNGRLEIFDVMALEHPMTYERIFSDPKGDLKRVEDALSRPECALEPDAKSQWELKSYCHADAFMNFATLLWRCHKNFGRVAYPLRDDLIHPGFLIRLLEEEFDYSWQIEQCQEFSIELDLEVEPYPEPFARLVTDEVRRRWKENPLYSKRDFLIDRLFELAAQLSDQAAALTDEGRPYGPYKGLWTIPEWDAVASKRAPPNPERLLNTFRFLKLLEVQKIEFVWEELVSFLCMSPYSLKEAEESTETPSCQTVISEMYAEDLIPDSMLILVDQFESVAIELDLY